MENMIETEVINGNLSREAYKSKIMTLIPSLAKCGFRSRNTQVQTKVTSEENNLKMQRKEKPAARKERKATQTLAIVLGKFQ